MASFRVPSSARFTRYPNAREQVAIARRAVIDFAKTCGLTGTPLEDLRSAVGEALANAAEHGHREGTSFTVRMWHEDGCVAVQIEDEGEGFDPDLTTRRDDSTRGYGLTIMRALVDRLTYDQDGRVVRLLKRIEVPHCTGNKGSSLTG